MPAAVPGGVAIARVALGVLAFWLGLRLFARGLKGAAGEAPRAWIARAARRPLFAFAAGLVATTAVQSSSATTVVAVALAGAGALPPLPAAWAVLGANVGTTLTAQLTAFEPGPWAGALFGAAAGLALHRPWRPWARACLGLGLVFFGLGQLDGPATVPFLPGGAAAPGHGFQGVAGHPVRAFVAGAAAATVLDSSSLVIGILQALLRQGRLALVQAIPVMLGANVGTTAGTVLAGVAGGRRAAGPALVHLAFNGLGAAVWLPLAPVLARLAALTAADPARQLANAHALFNGLTVLLVAPWLGRLVDAVNRLLAEPE